MAIELSEFISQGVTQSVILSRDDVRNLLDVMVALAGGSNVMPTSGYATIASCGHMTLVTKLQAMVRKWDEE